MRKATKSESVEVQTHKFAAQEEAITLWEAIRDLGDWDMTLTAIMRWRALAQLEEFDLIKRERPADPTYWDMHHRAALERAAEDKA